jgi:aspartyl-tRNA(Asn)/glutamyl-tRNA(Gln) amidotransferase subunit B
MEKGMVRCDVNFSVRPKGSAKLGAKIEIKNMNSFSGARRALEYEIPRQIEALKRGETLRQETRRWDDLAGITETMRSKEDAHDYRYFPEPDLMPLVPTDDWLALVKSQVVELPLTRKKRFIREYGLPDGDAEIFRDNVPLATFFERAIQGATQPKAIANWVINNLQARVSGSGLAVEEVLIQPAQVRDLVGLVESGAINSKIAQDVFAEMFTTGDAPQVIVERNGWSQMSDVGALEALCDQAIVANPGSAADFRAGKVAALNALKGQVMKLSKGKANPALAGEILERKLRA